jgi:hypothetical protein
VTANLCSLMPVMLVLYINFYTMHGIYNVKTFNPFLSCRAIHGNFRERSLGSNFFRNMDYLVFVCFVFSGRGLCDELITRPKKPYRLWRVVVFDQETSCDEAAIARAELQSHRRP